MKFLGYLVYCVLLFSCGNSSQEENTKHSEVSLNPSAFFYPICDSTRIYVYRDLINGLNEEFHRVYKVVDSKGPHLIVERYASDGRLLEAFNYNIDSLDLMDHITVNAKQEKEQAILFKNRLFPMTLSEEACFASKFRGVNDSMVILKEITRKFSSNSTIEFNNKTIETLVFKDFIRMTNMNIYKRKEEEITGVQMVYFSKGIGLTEWHSPSKSVHFKLEKILSQKQWVQLMKK